MNVNTFKVSKENLLLKYKTPSKILILKTIYFNFLYDMNILKEILNIERMNMSPLKLK